MSNYTIELTGKFSKGRNDKSIDDNRYSINRPDETLEGYNEAIEFQDQQNMTVHFKSIKNNFLVKANDDYKAKTSHSRQYNQEKEFTFKRSFE